MQFSDFRDKLLLALAAATENDPQRFVCAEVVAHDANLEDPYGYVRETVRTLKGYGFVRAEFTSSGSIAMLTGEGWAAVEQLKQQAKAQAVVLEKIEKLKQVLRRNIERHIENLAYEMKAAQSEFVSRGVLNSSMFVQRLGKLSEDKARQLAEDSVETLATIFGPDSANRTDLLIDVFEYAHEKIMEWYDVKSGVKRDGFPPSSFAVEYRPNVDKNVLTNLSHCVDELSIGLIKGKSIMSSGSGNVYISGSTGVAVGNSNVMQVGRDNLNQNVGWDPAVLLQAVRQFRETLAAENLPQETKDDLDDAALSLEREAQVDNPDHGRLKRLGKALKTRVESIGVGAIGGALGNALPAILSALPAMF